MERNYYIQPVFTVFFVLLALFLAAPASVRGATITLATIDELQKIGQDPLYPLNGDYVLGADIDASATSAWDGGAGFAPIGTSATPFSGSFDGAGNTIRNLFINREDADNIGLFGYVSGSSAPAAIRNVALVAATIHGRSSVGALVGCKDNCLIYNCSSSGQVSAQTEYAGGLVGKSQASTPITNCRSTSAVTGQLGIGGLVGYNSTCLIKNCYSAGAVSANEYAGGLVGWSQSGTQIAYCYATGAVTGQLGIGGLVGYNENTPLMQCYSTGQVSITENRAGSLIGGLIGYSSLVTASDCFWDKNTSGQKFSAGGTAKTTAEMKLRSTFTGAGWDYTAVWAQTDTQTYPFFRGNDIAPTAVPDSYDAEKNGTLTIAAPGVLANDSSAYGDTLTAILVSTTPTTPAHGTLSSFKADGSFTYTPEKGYKGEDSFTYRAQAGEDNSTDVIVTLNIDTVAPVAPVAVADSYSSGNLPLFVPALTGVLVNDTNLSDTSRAELVDPAPGGSFFEKTPYGSIHLDKNGWFIYWPGAGFTEKDSFTYQACTNGVCSNAATVAISYLDTNQPAASDDDYPCSTNLPLIMFAPGVLKNDSNLGLAPRAVLVDPAPGGSFFEKTTYGSIHLGKRGGFIYLPDKDFYGTDSFTYQACKNGASLACSDNATVVITVSKIL